MVKKNSFPILDPEKVYSLTPKNISAFGAKKVVAQKKRFLKIK